MNHMPPAGMPPPAAPGMAPAPRYDAPAPRPIASAASLFYPQQDMQGAPPGASPQAGMGQRPLRPPQMPSTPQPMGFRPAPGGPATPQPLQQSGQGALGRPPHPTPPGGSPPLPQAPQAPYGSAPRPAAFAPNVAAAARPSGGQPPGAAVVVMPSQAGVRPPLPNTPPGAVNQPGLQPYPSSPAAGMAGPVRPHVPPCSAMLSPHGASPAASVAGQPSYGGGQQAFPGPYASPAAQQQAFLGPRGPPGQSPMAQNVRAALPPQPAPPQPQPNAAGVRYPLPRPSPPGQGM